MQKLILLFSFFYGIVFSQTNSIEPVQIGKYESVLIENGIRKKKTVLNFLSNEQPFVKSIFNNEPDETSAIQSHTSIKWSYNDAVSIGDYCLTSGNGRYAVTGWDLNNERVSLYGISNSTPVWEFATDQEVFINFIAISDTGGVIGAGSLHNIYLFDNVSGVPFFNFDLTTTRDTGIASALDVTANGNFLVCTASNPDTSIVYGFNSSSTTPVWEVKLIPTVSAGAQIQGLRISGNDSLFIVNTYSEFFIFKTYSGELVFRGFINPGSPNSGTQTAQGISGDGKVIATINYSGYLRVYQWNGTTYSLLWQNQEPPGSFINWYASIDISYDGNMIAAGTLNFVSSTSFDGKIKVFKKDGNGFTYWIYYGCGDEVSAVSFSKTGNILSASSWGEFNNNSEDLYIFKTFLGNIPIFKVNTPGSLFSCNTSNDGKVVVASGKAVHARQIGSGGLLYAIDVDTSDIPPIGIAGNNLTVPENFKLGQNFPNPFNPSTEINYELPFDGLVTLKVYDMMGSEIVQLVNEKQTAARHSIKFQPPDAGRELSSGTYLYRLLLSSGSRILSDSKIMIYLK